MPEATSGITVSVSVLSQLVRYLSHLGIDAAEVLRAAGVDPEIQDHPDERLSIESYLAVEDRAALAAADPCFGLHMGEFHDPGHWSIVGYMMMNCRTLGEAFQKSGKYSNIIGNLISSTVRFGYRKATIILTTPRHAPTLSRHCFESAVSSSIHMMRRLSGRPLAPLEVGFSYPPPASPDEYRTVLGCPVLFGQRQTYLVLDMRLATVPVVAPVPALLGHFERYAEDYLAEAERVDATTRAVVRHILANLDNPGLSAGSAARELEVSVRTLQNRLKAEGTAFAALLEDTRERLAKRHLRENMTVEDITYVLGFSEPSAFRKAFKKWSGMTPKEYRDSVRASPSGQRSGAAPSQ